MAPLVDSKAPTTGLAAQEAPPAISAEKHEALHREHEDVLADEKASRHMGDYSGAVAKTDPAEIKLVRKLDLWIMVSALFCLPLALGGVCRESVD